MNLYNTKCKIKDYVSYCIINKNIFRFTNLMLKYRHREFWCTGYYVDTVGKNTKKIKEYIANQLKEDKRIEQLSMQELVDPFKKK